MIAVVVLLVSGALALISSTQTWLTVTLADSQLAVKGSESIPVLQPLSLAVLALGLALSIVGRVVRYVFGVLAVAIGAVLAWLSVGAAYEPGTSDVASVVTEHTGVAGEAPVSALVQSITSHAWPAITLALAILIVLVGVFTLATAHSWRSSSRKYDAPAERPAGVPLDTVDTWDDLSRGDDPTT
ncbi:MAG: Trp biosynthesis-associated membrane protein [Microbacterium sp.]